MWRFVLKQQRLSFSACFSLLGQSIVIFSTRPTKRIGIEQPWLWPKYSTWGFTWPSPLMPFFKNSWKNAVARSTLPAGYCSKVLINDSKPGLCSRTRFLGGFFGNGQMPPTSWLLINIASMDRGFDKPQLFFPWTPFFFGNLKMDTSKKGGEPSLLKKKIFSVVHVVHPSSSISEYPAKNREIGSRTKVKAKCLEFLGSKLPQNSIDPMTLKERLPAALAAPLSMWPARSRFSKMLWPKQGMIQWCTIEGLSVVKKKAAFPGCLSKSDSENNLF